ncbi:hypothetical protein [Pseudozobellia thermophila]|uniref:Protein required for attachment to host cells n=1 Tax=Pseudozobellia thermophila TaxID=192903 RepID=A0A1M6IMP1_9FLAO|nr:hypothetical protein [Pseudozobellia thermophila]SHJ35700.1 hypothetical protein SAMN04488513_10449 [Pseudozobellia thermophila]
MKRIGIWMDKEKAHIVSIEGEQERFETIPSELDFFKPSGGSGTKSAKWGPQDVVQDSKYLEKEKHQLKRYFNKLAEALGDAEAIALFGPADTSEKFSKELKTNHKNLAAKLKTVAKADSMTDNQIRALVREYFEDKR